MIGTSAIPKYTVICCFILALFGVLLGGILSTSIEHNALQMSNQITAQFVAVRKNRSHFPLSVTS